MKNILITRCSFIFCVTIVLTGVLHTMDQSIQGSILDGITRGLYDELFTEICMPFDLTSSSGMSMLHFDHDYKEKKGLKEIACEHIKELLDSFEEKLSCAINIDRGHKIRERDNFHALMRLIMEINSAGGQLPEIAQKIVQSARVNGYTSCVKEAFEENAIDIDEYISYAFKMAHVWEKNNLNEAAKIDIPHHDLKILEDFLEMKSGIFESLASARATIACAQKNKLCENDCDELVVE